MLGPRQVGKTTLVRGIISKNNAKYLDLENPADRQILIDPDPYLDLQFGKLVVIDEVQRIPDLFSGLRGQIDRRRHEGHHTGQFLLLGSASRFLLGQSEESLAGRVNYLELAPFNLKEIEQGDPSNLWLRGGFPESFLAESDSCSQRWRENFIGTYAERYIPVYGPRLPFDTLRRFWTMLAYRQSELWNGSALSQGLGVSGQTVRRYLDILVDLMLVRQLRPWYANVGKRLVKSPKVYLRDSGIVHGLLGIKSLEDLLSHPVVGGSWEGFCIENLIAAAPSGTDPFFYRTSAGAEIDLLLNLPDGELWAFEIKRSTSPKALTGFHSAARELGAAKRILVHVTDREVPGRDGLQAMSLSLAMDLLAAA